MQPPSRPARYRFARHGRAPHLLVDSPDELRQVCDLDPALWVASSAPVECINIDRTTIEYVDSDGNGRITHHEVSTAVDWLFAVLRDPGGIAGAHSYVRIADIDDAHPDGKRMATACRKITSRPDGDDESLTLKTVREIIGKIEGQPASGAGVVLSSAASAGAVRQLIDTIVSVTGGVKHPDGSMGVDSSCVAAFHRASSDHQAWRESAPESFSRIDTSLIGEGFAAILGKIDQFFALCTWAVLEPSSGEASTLSSDGRLMEANQIVASLGTLPLARPNTASLLELEACNNVVYSADLRKFFTGVVTPLLGRETVTISAAQWGTLQPMLTELAGWYGRKPDLADRVAVVEDLDNPAAELSFDAIGDLIRESTAAALDLENVKLLEKLIAYQQHLMTLVNNFVSFPLLYSRTGRAAFEKGCLIMDGKRFNLAVIVRDRKAHALLAKHSNMFVLYVTVFEKPELAAFEVAVPVTGGRKGNIALGKRGLFVDLDGVERDAEVSEMIENPISISQAVVSPFKRVGNMVTGKIEAITQDSQKQLDSYAAGNAEAFPSAPQASTGGALTGGGLLLGGSVAFAAIGSAIAYITNTLTQLTWWQFLAGLGGVIALVILPAITLAFIKLRRRDLSAIIEASGWAVNARMRLTHRLGRAFTMRPEYPKGSRGLPAYLRHHRRRRGLH
jgi:hypothetical protein